MTAPHSDTVPIARLAATRAYVASRGSNLITNGTGYLGDATNFPGAVLDRVDAPGGVTGSFAYPDQNATRIFTEQIPVNSANEYMVRYWARQAKPGGTAARHYFLLSPMDAYGNQILPQHHYVKPGTTTRLAQDLKPGDTKVYLESVAEWTTTSGSRHIAFWNYVDPGGKAWPVESYTRNLYTSIYPTNGVNPSENSITLSAPWSGPLTPAGTPTSNTQNGNNYLYPVSGAQIPEPWTRFQGRMMPGTTPPGSLHSVSTGWPAGTAACRVGLLINYQQATGVSEHKFAGFEMYEIRDPADLRRHTIPPEKVAPWTGPTNGRPTGTDRVTGTQYFDTTIGRPIWYAGSGQWIDATGTAV